MSLRKKSNRQIQNLREAQDRQSEAEKGRLQGSAWMESSEGGK